MASVPAALAARAATLLLLALPGLAPHAQAGIQRCTDASGQIRFTDQPCDGGEQQREVEIHDNRLENGHLRRDWAARQRREADEAARRAAEHARQRKAQQPAHDKAMKQSDCEAARRDLEFTIDATRAFLYEKNRQREIREAERRRNKACGGR